MSHTPHASGTRRSQRRPKRLPIETARLTLRAFAPGDAPKIFRMSLEPAYRTWLPSQVYRDEAQAASVLASLISCCSEPGDPRRAPFVLGVHLRSTDELIGHVGFSPFRRGVEVGFAIERVHQRKGLATEAVREACAWALEAFSIATIRGITAVENTASQGVLTRAGFGRRKQEIMRFQGREQAVVGFSFARRRSPAGNPAPAVGPASAGGS